MTQLEQLRAALKDMSVFHSPVYFPKRNDGMVYLHLWHQDRKLSKSVYVFKDGNFIRFGNRRDEGIDTTSDPV